MDFCCHLTLISCPSSSLYRRFCHCDAATAEVTCFPVNCPSKFGLDVINPFCLEWDEHADFAPSPPACCPPVPVCMSDGTCHYEGHK